MEAQDSTQVPDLPRGCPFAHVRFERARLPKDEVMASSRHADSEQVFAGGGETGALLRSMDWSNNPLGPLASWPGTLRAVVSTALNSRSPIVIMWGPDLITLCNDASRAVLGSKHPGALCAPARDVCPELWRLIGPMLERVLHDGNAASTENQPLLLERKGFVEECSFNFACSPIRDETGAIVGVYCAVTETTRQVQNERRLQTLRDLAVRTSGVGSVESACSLAAAALAENHADVAFSLLYVLEGSAARLVAATGVESGHPIRRTTLDLARDGTDGLPIGEAARRSEVTVVEHLERLFPDIAARTAFVFPIWQPGEPAPHALMVTGVSPHLELDDRYMGFLALVATQVATAIASARALEQARLLADQAQRQLSQSQSELRHADELRDEFFTVASHELRTPLTTLGFQADSLIHALRQAGPHDATAERCLPRAEKLRTQVTRLEQLIEAMLDVFSLGRGAVPSSHEELDLAEVARAIVERVRSDSRQATINLRAEASRGTWDRQHLEQILTQLISNAVKFGPGEPVDVLVNGTADAALIHVKDKGIGVAAEAHERIFGRFVRLAPTSQYGGFGVGLWTVRVLVQAMGGSVRVESTPGEGAEFIVELPRTR